MKNYRTQSLLKSSVLAAAALIGSGSALAAPGDLTGYQFIGGKLKSMLNSSMKRRGLSSLTEPGQCDVLALKINYESTGVSGETIDLSATVSLPWGINTICRTNVPLLADGHGTVTTAGYSSSDLENIEIDHAFFVSHGYAMVHPDYIGLGDSTYGYHPYLDRDTEASSMIDSIRAATTLIDQMGWIFGIQTSGKVMLKGYSQGGHTAMATAREIETNLLGEINLVASAPMAGPYLLESTVIDGLTTPAIPNAGLGLFMSYGLYAIQQETGSLYSLPSDIFQPPYDSLLETLYPGPQSTLEIIASGTYPTDAADIFQSDWLSDVIVDANHPFRVAVRNKEPLENYVPSRPMALCGSSDDGLVPYFNTEQAAQIFSDAGVSVPAIDVSSYIDVPPGYDPGTMHHTIASPICNSLIKAQLFDPLR